VKGDERRAGRRDGAREPGLGVARIGGHQSGTDAADERQKDDQREEHAGHSRNTISFWQSIGIDLTARAFAAARTF
jgi:hypothetical protein